MMEYQDTPIGTIPLDWKLAKIGEISEVKGGKRLPKGHKFEDRKTKHPYIRVMDFENMSINLENLKYLSEETFQKIKNYTINSNDVYISIAGTIGLSGVIPHEIEGANLTENAAKLTSLKDVDKYFLSYILNSEVVKPQINASTGKATQPKLALFRIKNILIPLPSLNEQLKIVEVLSTTDQAINKSDEIIVKTNHLKNGLMKKLLTEGISSKKFKNTPIGKIPTDWDFLQIKKLVKTYAGGTPSRSKDSYYGGNILWVKSGEVDQKRIYDTEEKITEDGFKNSSAKKVPKNSVLIAMYGATAGKAGILKSEGTTNQAVLALPPNDDRYSYEFLYYMISFNTARLMGITQGTGQPNLSKQIIDNVRIALPPLEEQHKIASILSKIENLKNEEIKRKYKLQRIQKGLMNDLLTGRKRVKVNN